MKIDEENSTPVESYYEDHGSGSPVVLIHGWPLSGRSYFTTSFFTAGDRSDLVSEPNRIYNRDIAAFASPKGTLDCIAAFGRTDFRDDLAKFDVPTLVIHGDSDAIVPFEVSGKRSHEAISDSSLVLIKGGPHGINATHVEQFNRALLDFLA